MYTWDFLKGMNDSLNCFAFMFIVRKKLTSLGTCCRKAI